MHPRLRFESAGVGLRSSGLAERCEALGVGLGLECGFKASLGLCTLAWGRR